MHHHSWPTCPAVWHLPHAGKLPQALLAWHVFQRHSGRHPALHLQCCILCLCLPVNPGLQRRDLHCSLWLVLVRVERRCVHKACMHLHALALRGYCDKNKDHSHTISIVRLCILCFLLVPHSPLLLHHHNTCRQIHARPSACHAHRLKASNRFGNQQLDGRNVGSVALPDAPAQTSPYAECPNPTTSLQYLYGTIFPDSMVAKCTSQRLLSVQFLDCVFVPC